MCVCQPVCCVHSLAPGLALTHKACCCYACIMLLRLYHVVTLPAFPCKCEQCGTTRSPTAVCILLHCTDCHCATKSQCCRRVRTRKQHPLPMVQQPPVQPLLHPSHPFPWVGLRLWTPLTTIPTGQSLTPLHATPFVVDVTSKSVHYRL